MILVTQPSVLEANIMVLIFYIINIFMLLIIHAKGEQYERVGNSGYIYYFVFNFMGIYFNPNVISERLDEII